MIVLDGGGGTEGGEDQHRRGRADGQPGRLRDLGRDAPRENPGEDDPERRLLQPVGRPEPQQRDPAEQYRCEYGRERDMQEVALLADVGDEERDNTARREPDDLRVDGGDDELPGVAGDGIRTRDTADTGQHREQQFGRRDVLRLAEPLGNSAAHLSPTRPPVV